MNRVIRAMMVLTASCALPLSIPAVAGAACVTPATKIIFAPQVCEAAVTAETPTSAAVAELAERKDEKSATPEKAPVQREAAPAPRAPTMHLSGRAR